MLIHLTITNYDYVIHNIKIPIMMIIVGFSINKSVGGNWELHQLTSVF